jgi:sarcosine oxidase
MPTYDAVVAGLGVSGASVTYMLAKRGIRVLGLDMHAPPHSIGSTHGRSRVIRAAYFENPLYAPLALRAFELWAQLEKATNTTLLRSTGALMIGPERGEIVQGTLASVRTHSLPHEILDAPSMQRRFPALTPRATDIAVLEHRAGMLSPEVCVQLLLSEAARIGADLRMDEPVLAWKANDDGVTVQTSRGWISAGALVFATGPWLPALLSLHWAGLSLEVERQFVLFFEPRGQSRVGPDSCPITIWEFEPGRVFYSLPDVGDGLKAAIHHEGDITDPKSVDRSVSDDELRRITSLLERLLPSAAGPVRERLVCLYTNTPDRHFLIDAHPEAHHTFVVSACSGHGFKFGPAIGEAVADWVLTRNRPAALQPFFSRQVA